MLHIALQVVQDGNTLLTPLLPHAAQQVLEALGGSGVWAAQPEIKEVDELGADGPPTRCSPATTSASRRAWASQARWRWAARSPGRRPIFTKLDPALGETGPEWAPIAR